MNGPDIERVPMVERVFRLLPADGEKVYYGALVARCHRELYLSAGFAGMYIGWLCTEERAAVEIVDGYTFIRRVVTKEVFPLRPRPQRPVPRWSKPRPRQGARPGPMFVRPRRLPARAGAL